MVFSDFTLAHFLIITIFCIGYAAIIAEHYLKVNKTSVALFVAIICWSIFFVFKAPPLDLELQRLEHHVMSIAQIIFFLIGAMTIVEIIDAHKGFRIVTECIKTTSPRKLLIIVAILTFFLSSVLDNLTTTILMISLLRKLIPIAKERFTICCVVVIAANAGGAWTPIGDITTTMLWIDGRLSSWAVIKALFLPSLISLAVPVGIYLWRSKGRFQMEKPEKSKEKIHGSTLVLCLGVLSLVGVPVFKGVTGLPPFMGVIIGLGVLWIVTDILHRGEDDRMNLKVPHILTKIDIAGILFFLGILLCVDALEVTGILKNIATYFDHAIHNQPTIALLIGFISAIIDNVPLVAATIGMYPLSQYPMDDTLWHMIAYVAGTGGSLLIIGSSSGVILMGMEKIDFISYMKKATLPVLIGFLAGFGVYLLLR